ncbi:hypothetical protein [Rubellimicrobium aerolatum]|uniref:Uncharacterized protein n=1 Tax=Rubellimicrobium aerolatum TaxID=490979 RepID=A0ABW0S8K2_9RHOB|nr:hypothetical protein [Rubellimicrobium aerolatum]MBP1804215.1 hypothetical protein [Rubellimicrobium aerolatum]
MTAQPILAADIPSPLVPAGSRQSWQEAPAREPSGHAMTLPPTHASDCSCQACRQARALASLDDWLEEEGPQLERILRLLGRPGALMDLAALQALHVEPDEDAEGLAEAVLRLERLLEELARTPVRADPAGPIPLQDRAFVRTPDAAVRWTSARTQETLAAIR